MSGRKLLIDTNVFIGLEDEREVTPELADMLQLCNQHAVRVFVHEDAEKDIQRDRDGARRAVSLSKIRKFELLKGVSRPSKIDLERRFGPTPKPNDEVDVALLHALDIGTVDFLVTQDQRIHSRAKRCTPPIYDRVLYIDDALAWLRATFEPKKVTLPLIEELPAHAIPRGDDIFDSLRVGYQDFDAWWREKCVREHRPCWVVTIDGELAGLVVRKVETHGEALTRHPGPKILKVCTFKVKPKFRGEKLGELLLKQVLWFAQKNSFDLVYLTTFEDQRPLISVLGFFGFVMTGTNIRGEIIFEKPLPRERLAADAGAELFELARSN
jgi:GNAT superfamily N-acetyltransferase